MWEQVKSVLYFRLPFLIFKSNTEMKETFCSSLILSSLLKPEDPELQARLMTNPISLALNSPLQPLSH